MFEDFYLNVQLLSEDAKMPTRATETDAGLDLYTPTDFIIFPNGKFLIDLKIRVEFPKGYMMLIRDKSGVAVNKHVIVGAGIIDSSFRGNVQVLIINYFLVESEFKKGDKIAQAIIVPVWVGVPNKVDSVSIETERGEKGFGSEVGYDKK